MKITPFGVAVIDGDSHLSRWIEENGKLDVDGTAHELAARFIKPGDVVVDAGACLGDHTIVYLNAVGPAGQVHAFEPNPPAFECLSRNCPKAVLHNLGLGRCESTGTMDMQDHHNVGAAILRNWPGEIRVTALDSFQLMRLNFLKLDVEGMEFEALCGAIETLARCRPVIMSEVNRPLLAQFGCSAEKLFDFMDRLRYRVEPRDPNYGLNDSHTEVLFIPK